VIWREDELPAYSIHTLGTRCRQVICFKPQLLYLHGQSHHHSMDKWLDGSQTNADAMNERKMPLPQNKSWSPCYPPHSLITILTELCQLTEGRKERGGKKNRKNTATNLLGRTIQYDSEESLLRIAGCIYHTTWNLRCPLI
jgi:hypothetical protein